MADEIQWNLTTSQTRKQIQTKLIGIWWDISIIIKK